MTATSIPVYELYGEANTGRMENAIHVEEISVRAHVHAWTILAHRHDTLSQLFLFAEGGGEAGVDGLSQVFSAPALIWLPAGCVHSFRLDRHTEGMVATIATDALAAISTLLAEIAPPTAPQVVSTPEAAAFADIAAALQAIGRAGNFGETGAQAARLLHLGLGLLAMRRCIAPVERGRPSAASALVTLFREAVERAFRKHRPISAYAADLGITADRLHDACTEVAGTTPSDILAARIMVEARRALTYTAMPVSGIAYDLGFEDPAYFSRYFARRAGVPPSAYRSATTGAGT
jgi:AraC family transcriptional activator of pobA